MRLEPQPGEVIDRGRPLSFTWNGRTATGFAGDTIASALAAAGERVFSRSLKYHRPRGLLTADAHDPGCIVHVDGEPNVRGAHRRLSAGATVSAQGVWPSLRFDVKALARLGGPALSAGFYYKTFMRPRRLWPLYERVLRTFSPGGPVPSSSPGTKYDHRHAHPDVVVAGGGPAGMAAALGAAAAGARVMLVDDQAEIGGHLRWSWGGGAGGRGWEGSTALLDDLRRRVDGESRIEVLSDSVVFGYYEDGLVAIAQRGLDVMPPTSPVPAAERLIKARPSCLVVASGLVERPYVVAGNDLPGVMLSSAVRRLINLYAVRPGRRAVVFTANDDGLAAAADLSRAGVDVRRVVDSREGGDIVRVRGRTGVREVECGDGRTVACDLLVMACGWTASTELITMAGGRAEYRPDAARFVPADLPDHVLATGGLIGDGTTEELIAHGHATGTEAARRAGRVAGDGPRPAMPDLRPARHPQVFSARTDGMVDFTEDVSADDIRAAVAEGYSSMELVKRYTTVTMGPTQGKLEAVNAIAVVADATGRTIAETAGTTTRPPYTPVSLGVLAGRNLQPTRRSPIHDWHVAHGATPLLAGEWIRPDHYGDPLEEAGTVRQGVGIIDVTPLGKFELRGPNVPDLLEQLYINRWRKLAVGQVRYGVMCADDGVVFDDGVTGRLGEQRYLLTATSSGAVAVGEWMERWLQTRRPDWQVHVIAMTDAYVSINVAGPCSRDVVSRLAPEIDLSPDSFPYMRVREGEVAGVPDCVVWRIGFTGELSYELHVPAGAGLQVWEALLRAGTDFGIRPFGVEAQRILRLEKGHMIVGQDTDGLTRAYSAGLDWAIKLDKPDFAGKPELTWQRLDDDSPVLVGLRPVDHDIVPPESSQIVNGSSIVGRITSSRFSPTLNRAVCLGFVAPHLAEPDTVVTVLLPDNRRIPAQVMAQLAHVDPEGVRLRV